MAMTAALGKHILELEEGNTDLLKGAKHAEVLAKRLERNAERIVSETTDATLLRMQRVVADQLRRNATLERNSAKRQRELAQKYAELKQKYLQISGV